MISSGYRYCPFFKWMVDTELNYGRDIIQKFLNQAKPINSVLDVGAGEGIDISLAKKGHPNVKYYAFEYYDEFVTALSNKGAKVYKVDIERDVYPFKNSSIDVIIMNQVLEHVKEIFWIFHQSFRVLKKGGHLIIGVPNLAALHNRFLLLKGIQPTSIKIFSGHVRGFTKHGLVHYFNEVSMGLVKLKAFEASNFYPCPPIIAKPLARLLPNFANSIFFLFQKIKDYDGALQKYRDTPLNRCETNYYLGEGFIS